MLSDFTGWLVKVILWLPFKIMELLIDGLVQVVGVIPGCECFEGVANLFSAIPPSVWWFLQIAQFPAGLSCIAAALLARFALRRLPFIGG
jgi:hypothetical protein